jgi:hypothetical protein
LFTKSKYAGIVAAVVYFCLSFVNLIFIGTQGSISSSIVYTFAVVPQFNMFQMVYWIFQYESIGKGIQTNNLWSNFGPYCPAGGFIMFVVGGGFFLGVGMYLEAVFPTDYGTQRPVCFPFMPSSYTCCRKRRQAVEEIDGEHADGLLVDL